MCPDCKRQKMLFETEAQAKNFIKFNGDEIDTHGGELRVYYCPACCGYHITSKEYNEKYEGRTERLIKAYKKAKKETEILDEYEKNKIKTEQKAKVVDKAYKKYMQDTQYRRPDRFMKKNYPNMGHKEQYEISKRIKHRQECDSLDWWRSMSKDDRADVINRLAILAVKKNVDEYDVLDKWLETEYKLLPKEIFSIIMDKCIIIRDEMG